MHEPLFLFEARRQAKVARRDGSTPKEAEAPDQPEDPPTGRSSQEPPGLASGRRNAASSSETVAWRRQLLAGLSGKLWPLRSR